MIKPVEAAMTLAQRRGLTQTADQLSTLMTHHLEIAATPDHPADLLKLRNRGVLARILKTFKADQPALPAQYARIVLDALVERTTGPGRKSDEQFENTVRSQRKTITKLTGGVEVYTSFPPVPPAETPRRSTPAPAQTRAAIRDQLDRLEDAARRVSQGTLSAKDYATVSRQIAFRLDPDAEPELALRGALLARLAHPTPDAAVDRLAARALLRLSEPGAPAEHRNGIDITATATTLIEDWDENADGTSEEEDAIIGALRLVLSDEEWNTAFGGLSLEEITALAEQSQAEHQAAAEPGSAASPSGDLPFGPIVQRLRTRLRELGRHSTGSVAAGLATPQQIRARATLLPTRQDLIRAPESTVPYLHMASQHSSLFQRLEELDTTPMSDEEFIEQLHAVVDNCELPGPDRVNAPETMEGAGLHRTLHKLLYQWARVQEDGGPGMLPRLSAINVARTELAYTSALFGQDTEQIAKAATDWLTALEGPGLDGYRAAPALLHRSFLRFFKGGAARRTGPERRVLALGAALEKTRRDRLANGLVAAEKTEDAIPAPDADKAAELSALVDRLAGREQAPLPGEAAQELVRQYHDRGATWGLFTEPGRDGTAGAEPAPAAAPAGQSGDRRHQPAAPDSAQQDAAAWAAKVRALYGPRVELDGMYDRLVNAVGRLSRLGGADAEGGLDATLERVAKRVLRLDPAAPVSDHELGLLLWLASRAGEVDRAESLAALGAYYLQVHREVFDDAHLLVDEDGRPTGWNWSTAGRMPLRKDAYAVKHQDGTLEERPAAWSPGAHVLAARAEPGSGDMLLRDRDNAEVVVYPEELPHLLRHDPTWNGDEVVLAVSNYGDNVPERPRIVAGGLGVRVWSPDNTSRLVTVAGRRMLVFEDRSAADLPTGQWVPADPGLHAVDPEGSVKLMDGTVVPDSAVQSFTHLTQDGRSQTGRMSTPANHLNIDENLRHMSGTRHFVHAEPLRADGRPHRESALFELPFTNPYVVGFHANSEDGGLILRDGTRRNAEFSEIGGFFGRRRSMQLLPDVRPVLALACFAAAARAGDLLEKPRGAQILANVWNRVVWATNAKIAHLAPSDGLPSRWRVEVQDIDHPEAYWKVFRPEPDETELTRLAGLMPRDAQGGAPSPDQVLRWVRALRLVFGGAVDDAQEAFVALLRGFAWLDAMRAASGESAMLTWARLRDLLAQYFAQRGQPEPAPVQALPVLLAEALSAAGQGLTIDHFLPGGWAGTFGGVGVLPGHFQPTAPMSAQEASGGGETLPGTFAFKGVRSEDGWWAARAAALPVRRRHVWSDPSPEAAHPETGEPLTTKADFLVRRFMYRGEVYTDLEVQVALMNADAFDEARVEALWQRGLAGVEELYNDPGDVLRLGNGDVATVTLTRIAPEQVPVAEGQLSDAAVTLIEPGDGAMTVSWWRIDALAVDLRHEVGHRLGLPDEHRSSADANGLRVDGSAMGDYNAPVEPGSGLAQSRLRPRNLARLTAIIGDRVPLSLGYTEPEPGLDAVGMEALAIEQGMSPEQAAEWGERFDEALASDDDELIARTNLAFGMAVHALADGGRGLGSRPVPRDGAVRSDGDLSGSGASDGSAATGTTGALATSTGPRLRIDHTVNWDELDDPETSAEWSDGDDGGEGRSESAEDPFSAVEEEDLLPAAVVPVNASAILPPPVWFPRRPVYRADRRAPEVIFAEGFVPRDPSNLDLDAYVRLGLGSDALYGFVGTGASREWVASWRSDGYVYEVDASGGLDVTGTLSAAHIPYSYDEEDEVAFAGGVASRYIKGAWRIVTTGRLEEDANDLGEWIANPHFRPVGDEGTAGHGLVRAELHAVVRRVVGEGAAHAGTVAECLTLLQGLRRELFPDGVRASGVLDDSALDRRSAQSSLVMGEDWQRVEDWESVAGAVERQGYGASALILAGRPGDRAGHAWAAYYPRPAAGEPDRGVVWVELLADERRRLSDAPPEVAPYDATAVVIDPSGQAVGGALPAFAESSSDALALVDAPTDRRYGALGVEAEDRHFLTLLDGTTLLDRQTGLPLFPGKVVVAQGPGIDLLIEYMSFWRAPDGSLHKTRHAALAHGQGEPRRVRFTIGEFVVQPMAALPGEQRPSAGQRLAGLARAREALGLTDLFGISLPLSDLLTPTAGWEVTEVGARLRVHPSIDGPSHPTYNHYTVGLATSGLRGMLNLASGPIQNIPVLWTTFETARSFGQRVAESFLHEALGERGVTATQVPFLAAIPDVDEVWGYGWLMYSHVSALPANQWVEVLTKNMLPVASRHSFGVVHAALRPRTQAFLERHHEALTDLFLSLLRSDLRHYEEKSGAALVDLGDLLNYGEFFDPESGYRGRSLGDQLSTALLGHTEAGDQVSAWQSVGMDDYPELDTDGGRLAVPLVLVELRQHVLVGGRFMSPFTSPEELRQVVAQLISESARTYARAVRHAEQPSDDVLRAMVRGVLGHPLVRAFAPLLDHAAALPEPQAEGVQEPLLAEHDALRLAEAIGAVALGEPLPPAVAGELTGLLDRLARQAGDRGAGNAYLAPEVRARLLSDIGAASAELAAVMSRQPSGAAAVDDLAQRIQQDWSAKVRELYGPEIETHRLFDSLVTAVARITALGTAEFLAGGLDATVTAVAGRVLGFAPDAPASLEQQLELVSLVASATPENRDGSVADLVAYRLERTRRGGRQSAAPEGAGQVFGSIEVLLGGLGEDAYHGRDGVRQEALADRLSRVGGFSHPGAWLDLMAPAGDVDASSGMADNCVVTAMAVHSTFHGVPQVPQEPVAPPVSAHVVAQEWTGFAAEYFGEGRGALGAVLARVEGAGAGSGALVFGAGDDGWGHVWNVLSVPGTGVLWVDGHTGEVRPADQDPLHADRVSRVWAVALDAANDFIAGPQHVFDSAARAEPGPDGVSGPVQQWPVFEGKRKKGTTAGGGGESTSASQAGSSLSQQDVWVTISRPVAVKRHVLAAEAKRTGNGVDQWFGLVGGHQLDQNGLISVWEDGQSVRVPVPEAERSAPLANGVFEAMLKYTSVAWGPLPEKGSSFFPPHLGWASIKASAKHAYRYAVVQGSTDLRRGLYAAKAGVDADKFLGVDKFGNWIAGYASGGDIRAAWPVYREPRNTGVVNPWMSPQAQSAAAAVIAATTATSVPAVPVTASGPEAAPAAPKPSTAKKGKSAATAPVPVEEPSLPVAVSEDAQELAASKLPAGRVKSAEAVWKRLAALWGAGRRELASAVVSFEELTAWVEDAGTRAGQLPRAQQDYALDESVAALKAVVTVEQLSARGEGALAVEELEEALGLLRRAVELGTGLGGGFRDHAGHLMVAAEALADLVGDRLGESASERLRHWPPLLHSLVQVTDRGNSLPRVAYNHHLQVLATAGVALLELGELEARQLRHHLDDVLRVSRKHEFEQRLAVSDVVFALSQQAPETVLSGMEQREKELAEELLRLDQQQTGDPAKRRVAAVNDRYETATAAVHERIARLSERVEAHPAATPAMVAALAPRKVGSRTLQTRAQLWHAREAEYMSFAEAMVLYDRYRDIVDNFEEDPTLKAAVKEYAKELISLIRAARALIWHPADPDRETTVAEWTGLRRNMLVTEAQVVQWFGSRANPAWQLIDEGAARYDHQRLRDSSTHEAAPLIARLDEDLAAELRKPRPSLVLTTSIRAGQQELLWAERLMAPAGPGREDLAQRLEELTGDLGVTRIATGSGRAAEVIPSLARLRQLRHLAADPSAFDEELRGKAVELVRGAVEMLLGDQIPAGRIGNVLDFTEEAEALARVENLGKAAADLLRYGLADLDTVQKVIKPVEAAMTLAQRRGLTQT
ncbi:lonely Cys domain-containing protein, partial [Streptomyces sp. NPDC056492]|uniref:lonely Cys domain-containing protein n=1 Tax=Streptomyces sp. NPDC056492 TaxID=3345838 RepID=UPI00367DCB3F